MICKNDFWFRQNSMMICKNDSWFRQNIAATGESAGELRRLHRHQRFKP